MRGPGPRLLRAVVILVVVAMVATSNVRAAADDASDEAQSTEAKKHYQEGTKAFNLAEFSRAIAEFKAAYNAKPDPLLLYNIAQSFRLAGDDPQALLFYKSFLRNMPDAPNRKEVDGQIRTLEKRVAEHKKESLGSSPTPAIIAPAPVTSPATASETVPAPQSPTAPVSPPTVVETVPGPAPGETGVASQGARSTPTTGLTLTARPPSTESVTHAPVEVSTSAEPVGDEQGERAFYKRWWFWAGVGAVALVAVGIAGSARNANKSPSTTLGLYQPTFK